MSLLDWNSIENSRHGIAVSKKVPSENFPLPLKGEIEVDESYFGARGKIIVFGLLKRQGKVYTEIIYDCSAAVLQKFIREKVVTLAA